MKNCKSKHTEHPTGYIDYQAWAEKMLETHEQTKCPDCGLFAIWVPKGMNLPKEFLEHYYTEEQMMPILGLKASTMAKKRIMNDGSHPPSEKIGINFYYPKDQFYEWSRKRQKRAS